MTVPFACVLIAFILIYALKIPVGMAMARLPAGYDNHMPRAQQAMLEGSGKRALAAHQNAFESFGPFAAGVFVANLGHASSTMSAALAIGFVVLRIVYSILYIADAAGARSAVWMLSMLSAAGLYLLPFFR